MIDTEQATQASASPFLLLQFLLKGIGQQPHAVDRGHLRGLPLLAVQVELLEELDLERGPVVFGEAVVLGHLFQGGPAAETGVHPLEGHHVGVPLLVLVWLFGEKGLSDREVSAVVVLQASLGPVSYTHLTLPTTPYV